MLDLMEENGKSKNTAHIKVSIVVMSILKIIKTKHFSYPLKANM